MTSASFPGGVGWIPAFLACLLQVGRIVTAQEPQNVTILFFYEDPHLVKYLDAGVDFITSNPNLGARVVHVHKIFSNGTNETLLVNELCVTVDAIQNGTLPADVIVDFTRHGEPSEAVKIIARTMSIPTVSTAYGQDLDIKNWRDMDGNAKKFLIQVSPPPDLLVQSTRSIVDKQDMTSATLFYDEHQYDMYHKHKSLLQNLPCRHLLTKLKKDAAALRKEIDRHVHMDVANFFIAASPNEISAVLAEASDKDMRDGPYFTDEYAWFSMSLEEGSPRCTGCKNNLTLIHLTPELANLQGGNRRKFLGTKGIGDNRLSDLFYFDIVVSTIVTVSKMKADGQWKVADPIIECVSSVAYKFEVDNAITYTFLKPTTLDLNLFEAFKTETSSSNILPLHLTKNGENYPTFTMRIERLIFKEHQAEPQARERIGSWTTGFGEKNLIAVTDGKASLWKAHEALTVFRIVTVVQPPFIYKIPGCVDNSPENKYSRCFQGYCIDLLEKIQTDLQFNYTIRNVSDYGYMNSKPPHEWNGIVRELQDRKADLAIGAISVMAEREAVIDFTVPFYDLVGISILTRKPTVTTSLFKFLTVLENDVWMCILGAYFFTSFLMWVFDRWSPYSYHNNQEKYEDDEEKRDFSLKECLWFSMTSLTPQGGGEAPKNLSGRIAAGTWWMFGFIIIASYTANLAAFLTVSRLDAPIESLDDLSKQHKIQYAPQIGSPAWIYFERMANIELAFYEIWKNMALNDTMSKMAQANISVWDYPVSTKYTKMFQAMQENFPPKTFEDAIRRVTDGGEEGKGKPLDRFAFIAEATDVKYQEKTHCIYAQVGEEFSRKPYAIAVQKGSPLKESFSHMILKLLNQRHLEQLKERWWNDNPRTRTDCPKDDNQSDGISIHNIGGVFIVIFVGIVLACFTLIFEYWWFKKRNVAEELAEMSLPDPAKLVPTDEPGIGNVTSRIKQQNRTTGIPSIEDAW